MKKLATLVWTLAVVAGAWSQPAWAQLGGGSGFSLDFAITQVRAGGFDELVAVENRNPFPINLSGWTLEAGTLAAPGQHVFAFPAGCALPPGGAVRVHAGPAVWFRGATPCGQADIALNWRTWFTLADGAGVITFKDPSGKVIAQRRYPDGATTVVVNEVELNPAGADRGAEWVELYNAGSHAVDLTGWSVGATRGTSVKLSVPLEGTLQPGGYRRIQVGVEFLNDTAEGVELRAPDGSLVDRTPEAGFVDLLDDGRCWARVADAQPGWTFQPCTPAAGNAARR